MTRRSIAILIAVVGMGGTSSAHALTDEWKPSRIWVTGSMDRAWVVATGAAKAGEVGDIRMWSTDAKAAQADQPPLVSGTYLPPVRGDAVAVAADREALKVLFSDGTIRYYFADKDSTIGVIWNAKSDMPPMTWAGDDAQDSIYAIVLTSRLIAPPTEATRPADDDFAEGLNADADSESNDGRPLWLVPHRGTAAPPATRHSLLAVKSGFWEAQSVPAAADSATDFWLAARKGRVFLFWRGSTGDILCSENTSGDWSKPNSVLTDASFRCGWAGSTSNGPVFIAGIGPDIRSVRLHIFARQTNSRWIDAGTVREGSDSLTVDGVTTGVGVAAGRLALARLGDKNTVEFAWGDATGSPIVGFSALSNRVDSVEEMPTWRTMIVPAILMAIMGATLFSKRERVVRPAVVPPGFVIAPIWKRLAATVLDFIPAMLAWFVAFTALFDQMGLSDNPVTLMDQLRSDPALVERLLPFYLLSVLVYGMWCMIWELTTASTPGKRVFACRVLSADGLAPTGRQIVIRNLIRIMMVSLGESGLLVTFLTMVLLSRNCQRLGDILANTVVIHPGSTSEIPVARPRERDEDDRRGT